MLNKKNKKENIDRMTILEQTDAIIKEFNKILEDKPRATKLEVFNLATKMVLGSDHTVENVNEIQAANLQAESFKKYLNHELDNQIKMFEFMKYKSISANDKMYWDSQIQLCKERAYVYNLSERGDCINAI